MLLTVAQGRRAVKRGTLRSCQQAKDLIRVNTSQWLLILEPEAIVVQIFTFQWALILSLLCCSPTRSTFPCSHYVWRSFTQQWWLIRRLLCASAPGSKRSSVTQVLPLSPLYLHYINLTALHSISVPLTTFSIPANAVTVISLLVFFVSYC